MPKKAKVKVTKPVAKAATPTAPAAPAQSLIPVIKSTALSVDVGPKVIGLLADNVKFDHEATELRRSAEGKKHDALAAMTYGVVKALRADASINAAAVFADAKDVSKARLNNQLYYALGFKAPISVGEGKAKKTRFTWTERVSPYVEADGSADPAKRQKDTVRTNLAHMLTKAVHGAIHIVENKLEVKTDKASGTLQLTGPAVKGHFGEATVLLNEKQTVVTRDKKGNKIGEKQLKAKPSFTEIARLGAEAHGRTFNRRVDSRAAAGDPNKHIADLCGMLVKAIEKAPDKLSDAAVEALESVQSAIENVI